MNSEKFPNVFIIKDEEMVYGTLEEAQNQCADWQTIIEYRPVFTYTPERIMRYKIEAIVP